MGHSSSRRPGLAWPHLPPLVFALALGPSCDRANSGCCSLCVLQLAIYSAGVAWAPASWRSMLLYICESFEIDIFSSKSWDLLSSEPPRGRL